MLKADNCAIAMIDVQGKLAQIVEQSEQMHKRCETLLKAAQILGIPIIYVEQNPDKLGRTSQSLLNILDGAQAIEKYTFNACKEPYFVNAVKEVDKNNWLVFGVESHICVFQTCMGLHSLGLNVECIVDASSSREAYQKDLAMSKLQYTGIGLQTVEMALYEIMEDCRSDAFKKILPLIKDL